MLNIHHTFYKGMKNCRYTTKYNKKNESDPYLYSINTEPHNAQPLPQARHVSQLALDLLHELRFNVQLVREVLHEFTLERNQKIY